MQEVTLMQMLEARENRVLEQQRLLREYGVPLICFTMNIPGPVKYSPLIERAFEEGCRTLGHRLPENRILHRSIRRAVTGCQAIYAVSMDAAAIKKICTAIEDDTALGRLFDMDVLDIHANKLDRELVGGNSRDCIVCGAPGRGCASRRSHSVPELQQAATAILTRHFMQKDARQIGSWAIQSLLDEVCTTPKPGLVDRRNNGSHRDMDIFTFMSSASALAPYFCTCVRIGQETSAEPPEETFRRLRAEGLKAEQDMYAATAGVNTHKGAVFTMGILCGAAGRLWKPEVAWNLDALFCEVSSMSARAMQEDWNSGQTDTAGQQLYARNGIQGIRGEVARGLPSVAHIGLPAYRACRADGLNHNKAGAITLLHLIAQVEDTNLIVRGGADGAREAAIRALSLLEHKPYPTRKQIEQLDDWFIRRNLSPGGCADLLAAVYFAMYLTTQSP